MNDFREIITKRRDGLAHTQAELEILANGAADGSIPDYQLSAWLMAAYLCPLTLEETSWLTLAMANSGVRLDLSELPGPHLDKHSTGGVGDKTTIVLLPLLASCGLTIVKMSGSGLGITGGTVDKLGSIPGFNLKLPPEQMIAIAREVGIAISGQTLALAPADGRLYSLRDSTATTSSVPLIASSILSKKIAGGAEKVMLDVKVGSGGFMHSVPEAIELAEMLERVGEACGLAVHTVITDMSQPLGSAVGNALEVREALDVLAGGQVAPCSQRFKGLCVRLASDALVYCGLYDTLEKAQARVEVALSSGAAMERAEAWIGAQGGPAFGSEIRGSLPVSNCSREVFTTESGWIADLDAGVVGNVVVQLGGGRRTKADPIDLSVGITFDAYVGSKVEKGQRLFTVFAKDKEDAERAETMVIGALKLSSVETAERPLFV